jgi:hypothetical protein
MIDRLPGRQVMGEQSPGTAAAHQVRDSIDDLALAVEARSSMK